MSSQQAKAREQVYIDAESTTSRKEPPDTTTHEDPPVTTSRRYPSDTTSHRYPPDTTRHRYPPDTTRHKEPIYSSYQERLDKPDLDNDILHRSILNPEVNAWVPPCNEQEDNSKNVIMQLMDMQASYLGQIVLQQQQSSLSLTLPTPEVPTFEGNPIEYCTFVRAFESLIESRTISSSARLYYLVQFTKGDVQDLMKSCLVMEPDAGYREARTLLKKKYGQDYKIATAYIDQVTKGAPISQTIGLPCLNFRCYLLAVRTLC